MRMLDKWDRWCETCNLPWDPEICPTQSHSLTTYEENLKSLPEENSGLRHLVGRDDGQTLEISPAFARAEGGVSLDYRGDVLAFVLWAGNTSLGGLAFGRDEPGLDCIVDCIERFRRGDWHENKKLPPFPL